METLFDKVWLLISAHFNSRLGRKQNKDRPMGFEQRLRKTVFELLRTEAQIADLSEQLQIIQQSVSESEAQMRELDRDIDSLLLSGNEAAAVKAQRRLNQLERRLHDIQVRTRIQKSELKRLLSAKDTLEVKLSLMGLERETLDAYLRQAQNQQKPPNSNQTWRVVD